MGIAVPKFGDEVFRLDAGPPFRAVGDLLSELIALAEIFPDGVDDIFGVAVVLGEDQRLRDFFATGKYIRKSLSR